MDIDPVRRRCLVLPKCGLQLVGRWCVKFSVMFLVRELSFRFCYKVIFGHDHCRRIFISRFNNDRRFLLFQYCIDIVILTRWIPGRFGRKMFLLVWLILCREKYRSWICLAKRLMDACRSSKSLVCGVGIIVVRNPRFPVEFQVILDYLK